MAKKFWGNRTPKVPDTIERIAPASAAQFEDASTAASALHALIKSEARFPGFEVAVNGNAVTLETMTRASGLRDVLLSLTIKQGDSGTWWLSKGQIARGTEVDPGTVRETTDYPLSQGYGVVNRIEYSDGPFVPFKAFTPDRDRTTEAVGDPLTGELCQGVTRQLKDIAATAILPEIVVA